MTAAVTQDPEAASEPQATKGHRRRRRRVRVIAGAAGAALLVGAGTAATVGFGGTDEQSPTRNSLPPATTTVGRTTLTQTETVDGTLSYGDTTVVKARGTAGTVTWLPSEGTTIRRGAAVYRVDADPVPLFYGSATLYRTLAPGMSGSDVAMVEKNLSALGYRGFTVDDEFTSATADAVRDWQDDLGLPENGRVAAGDVVVAPGAIRVTELRLSTGDTAGGPVLTYTGTTRTVTVPLDVDKQQYVRKGVTATVKLPDDTEVPGKVSKVGTVATTTTVDNQQTTTLEITVAVSDQKALGTLDQAPVDVVLQTEQRKNVLVVPVNALVALAEGGYGLQAVDGSATRYVAVKTGMFADGRVEVSGAGVTPGLVVGVPK
jgi:hypothetical protein